MDKRKLNNDELAIPQRSKVKVTTMNHIVEVQYLSNRNDRPNILKLNKREYVDLRTGEVKEFKKTENRAENENSLRKTFDKIRKFINTNFVGSKNELFITLTYRGELQTNDTKKLYSDFEKFIKRLKYRYKDKSTIDYINIVEPHASGYFHMHGLIRFNDLGSIFIPNEELAKLWGNGFVKVESLNDVDNVGAYVSSYLANIEADKNATGDDIEEKVVNGEKKKFIKGGRLKFYPPGINIFRRSRGIIDPEEEEMTYSEAQKKLGAATPSYVQGVEISDKEFNAKIIKQQYNLNRKGNK